MMLILGTGTLATALATHFPDSTIAGRPRFDFSQKQCCDELIDYYMPSIVINTVAVGDQSDPWQILTTNFTSAVYLTLKFYEKMSQGQLINISSASALWPSYPGIDHSRLCYNISKESLSQFGRHLNRAVVDSPKPVTISTLEIGKFASRLNNYQDGGIPIERVVSSIADLIQHPRQQVTEIK